MYTHMHNIEYVYRSQKWSFCLKTREQESEFVKHICYDFVFCGIFPRLQDDYRRQQRDIEQTKEESGAMETRLQSLMARASRELAEKITELEELKTQAITPEKLEVMKVQIAENLEEPFRERFGKLEEELEHYRTEYNKLRYEHSFLKSEYEHETAEHKRIIEEMKLQYETEVGAHPILYLKFFNPLFLGIVSLFFILDCKNVTCKTF